MLISESLPFVIFFGGLAAGLISMATDGLLLHWWGLWVPLVFALRWAAHHVAKGADCKALLATTDLRGKVAIVTGANSGIGYYTALQLAEAGATVVLTCRTVAKSREAADKMRVEIAQRRAKRVAAAQKANPGQRVTEIVAGGAVPLSHKPDIRDTFCLETDNFQSVRKFVEEFTRTRLPLHILVNNAGMMVKPLCFSQHDPELELHTAVNFLGPHLLTELLLPQLRDTVGSRVVFVSSAAHNFTLPMDKGENGENTGRRGAVVDALDKLNRGAALATGPMAAKAGLRHAFSRYGYSKCFNIYSAHFFANYPGAKDVFVCALHPGLVATAFGDSITVLYKYAGWLLHFFQKTSEEGSQTTVYCCLCPLHELIPIHAQTVFGQATSAGRNVEEVQASSGVAGRITPFRRLAPYFAECAERTKGEMKPIARSLEDAREVIEWGRRKLKLDVTF